MSLSSLTTILLLAAGLLLAACHPSPTSDTAHHAGEAGEPENPAMAASPPSFEQLRMKADAGERLDVVFLGGSLTWGANASDAQRTSYRALVSQRMLDLFPKSQIRFHDAAIGGTGSQLGVFRLQRDVLAHGPDLVFLDFTANDDIRSAKPEKLASYEAIVRDVLQEGRCPMVIVIFPFKGEVKQGDTREMPGRDATIEIAEAYNIPVGDAVTHVQQAVREGSAEIDELWPWDGAHPNDKGYVLFADAAFAALQRGLADGREMRVPDQPLHGSLYAHVKRLELASFGDELPAGWRVDTPSRIAAWYDGLMSRWLDSVVVADAKRAEEVKPLKIRFRAKVVGVFGEETIDSGRYRVFIDGKAIDDAKGGEFFNASAKRFGGNRQHFKTFATDLDEGVEHELVIEPILDKEAGHELRLESICLAGTKEPEASISE